MKRILESSFMKYPLKTDFREECLRSRYTGALVNFKGGKFYETASHSEVCFNVASFVKLSPKTDFQVTCSLNYPSIKLDVWGSI